jgi:lambda family phage tail tape measure protein
MADLTYTASLDDKISPALARIQQQTKKTADAFGAFKTALAGLAIGAAIQSALRYADAITDVADATEMAVQNVIGFSKAVSAAGGNSEKAQAAMVKFNNTLGDAAQGGLAAQDAFAQIGITLTDLRTLSSEDLFGLTVKRLGELGDVGLRTKLTNDLLGKSLRGVNLKGLSDDYARATAASAEYAESVRKGAELQDKLDAAFSKIKLSILSSIEPLVTFLNSLDTAKIDQFISAVVKIAAAATAILGLAKAFEILVKAVGLLGGVFALYKTGLLNIAAGATGAVAAITSLGKTAAITATVLSRYAIPAWLSAATWSALGTQIALTFSTLATRVGFATAAFGGLSGAVAAMALGVGKVALAFVAVGAAVVGINELIKLAFDIDPIDSMATKLENLVTSAFPSLAAGINKVGAALGMAAPPSQGGGGAGRGNGQLHLELYKKQNEELARQTALADEKLKLDKEIQDALAKQKLEIAGITAEFRKQLDSKAGTLQLETELIGKSEQQKQILQVIADLTRTTTDEVDKLTKARDNLNAAEKRGGLGQEYDKQIAAVQALSKSEQMRLVALVSGLNDAKNLEELRLFGLKEQQGLEDKLLSIQREMADLTLSDIEKKYREIARAADDSAKAAIRAEEARRGAPLNSAEQAAYYAASKKGIEGVIAAQKQLTAQSRSFGTGWAKAWAEYTDAATNAAAVAGRVFDKFTSGLEDAIVGFAKTGKFQWKTFVADMAEELLRSQIKSTIASFGDAIGLGSLFGGAAGGGATRGQSANSPMYVYDVSSGGTGGGGLFGGGQTGQQGGSGGGIFDTIGNIFGGVKDAVGNVFGGIGDAIGGVVDTIGGIFSGGGGGGGGGGILDTIGSFFDGFFANGGNIGAGKFGIVGERGPEFVGGPASVTPMSGGSVTYNISAVDAASFQALVARDPQFIHAVAMQGGRGIPSYGR